MEGPRHDLRNAGRIVYLHRCRYVTVNHARILAQVGGYDHDQVKRYVTDWRGSDLDEPDKGLLAFAEKLALRSHAVTRDDVEGREAGVPLGQTRAWAQDFYQAVAETLGA